MAMFQIYSLDEQTKTLPIMDTASGNVASFDTDLTENLIEVKCQIVAKQSGSGTPSPDNERPIETYTEMNVTRCGANLLNSSLRVNGYYISATGVMTPESNSCYIFIKVNEGETYTFSGRAYGGGNKRVHAYDKDKNWIEQLDYQSMSGTGDYFVTVTIPSGCQYVGLSFAKADGNCQFIASDEVLPYVEYNGTTSNIPFGQTVANGVLDVTTGKLRVTHVFSQHTWGEFTNKTSLGSNTRGGIYVTSEGMAITNHNTDICNIAPYTYNFTLDTTHFYLENNGLTSALMMFLPNDTSNDTVIQICYELKTPQEIQLDSIALQALLNENNVWCDTGDTEVKYLLSVGKKIA